MKPSQFMESTWNDHHIVPVSRESATWESCVCLQLSFCHSEDLPKHNPNIFSRNYMEPHALKHLSCCLKILPYWNNPLCGLIPGRSLAFHKVFLGRASILCPVTIWRKTRSISEWWRARWATEVLAAGACLASSRSGAAIGGPVGPWEINNK